MKKNPNYTQTKETVARFMQNQGWDRVDESSFYGAAGIAAKEYDTAVGKKQAIAYFTSVEDGVEQLTVDYQSEGRNIVASKSLSVWPSNTTVDIQDGVKKFCNAVDNAIDKSYARGLKLSQKTPAGLEP